MAGRRQAAQRWARCRLALEMLSICSSTTSAGMPFAAEIPSMCHGTPAPACAAWRAGAAHIFPPMLDMLG